MPQDSKAKNIYLFFGEDNYSASQKSRLWRKEFEKKYGDMNIEYLEGKKMTAEEFSTAVSSMPFLSEKKLVVVADFIRDGKEIHQKKVAEKLEKIDEFCLVLFMENDKPDARLTLYKKINKFGKVEQFNLMIGPLLTSWINTEAHKKGLKLSREDVSFLAENVGPNLWKMKQELEKLSLYSLSAPLSSEVLEKLVTPNITASVFKLTDYLGQKKKKESLKIFHTLIESGEDVIKIFFMIVRQFRIIIEISECLEQRMSSSDIAKKIKEHPFVVSNTLNQSKNFERSQLQKTYKILLNMDSDLKKGKIQISTNDNTQFQMALEKFIIEMCQE